MILNFIVIFIDQCFNHFTQTDRQHCYRCNNFDRELKHCWSSTRNLVVVTGQLIIVSVRVIPLCLLTRRWQKDLPWSDRYRYTISSLYTIVFLTLA